MVLTDSCNDGNGEEQWPCVRPQFSGIIVFTVPSVPLRCHVNLTATTIHC